MSTRRNPYTNYGKITTPRDFYGRERELRDVFSLIQASQPQCVSIVGERRIGKSSLLAMICHPQNRHRHLVNPEAYVFVPVDLLEMGGYEEWQLWRGIAAAIRKKTGTNAPRHEDAEGQEGSLADEYDRVKSCVERLQKAGKKIILALDEFESITRNPECSLDCLGRFRALAGKYDLGIVTTTRLELADACHDPELTTSPFFNIFASTITLGPLDDKALSRLVVEPSSAAGCPLTFDLLWVRAMSGGLPYVAQRACYELFEHRNEADEPRDDPLSTDEYARLEGELCDWLRPFFEMLWKDLSVEARRVIALAAKSKAIPRKLANVASSLSRYGLVRQSKPFSPLFAGFIEDKRRWHRRSLEWKWIAAAALGLAAVWGVPLYLNAPAFQKVCQYFAGLAAIALAVPLAVKVVRQLRRGSQQGNAVMRRYDDL